MAIAARVITRFFPSKPWSILTPFPRIAKSGITKRNITTTPPNKFPTNISGFSSDNAVRPIENSGIDVKRPRIKKEKINFERLSLFEYLSTEEIINPAPIQIKKNEKR